MPCHVCPSRATIHKSKLTTVTSRKSAIKAPTFNIIIAFKPILCLFEKYRWADHRAPRAPHQCPVAPYCSVLENLAVSHDMTKSTVSNPP